MPSTRSILVKSAPIGSDAFGISGRAFTSRPLFHSIGQSDAFGAAPQTQWQILTSPDLDDVNLWDACHELVTDGLGVTGGVEFAEPNLQQQWLYGDDESQILSIADGCAMAPENCSYPVLPNPRWCRDESHSDFDTIDADGTGVRIAHFDTGYDPSHLSLPRGFVPTLQRNFVDPASPNNAADQTGPGVLHNIGHGTGTLSILAGASDNRLSVLPVGAASGAEVVCIRVANSVVLFENSAIAQAFDYVHGLSTSGDPSKIVDVITMSMGGLASQAWADAVNALYDIGVFVVTAAGNNFGNMPTRNIVFPARFRRVVAACGVMADQQPYANLALTLMAGNYGPDSKMDTAMAAYTPNVPWAKFGCPTIVNEDGNGTSSATPQIAGAAALWIAKFRAQLGAYPQPWMKVEAIRAALFGTARDRNRTFFGKGTLDAAAAFVSVPAPAASLQQQPVDNAFFPLLRTLAGLGVAATPPQQERMLELEALQLSQSKAVEDLLPDPQHPPTDPKALQQIADALASNPSASQTMRRALNRLQPAIYPVTPPAALTLTDKLHLQNAMSPDIPAPTIRPLRIFAYDPSMEEELDTLGLNLAEVSVRYEPLGPGPVGEYIEVIDFDPASDACYAPIDLDNPHLLMQKGRIPSEGNAQFHQQMVYAVSMKTIEHFERALGRVALWSPHVSVGATYSEEYVQRLRIYPHALREANAFYSPDKKALLFGYFTSSQRAGTGNVPGTLVFACLSYDIVAHETTHALLDGLHRRYREPTNRDMLAFHEAFADIVALFQHFTVPEAVRDQIAKTRGDLTQENLLADLAVQFGQSTSGRASLRQYVGTKPKRSDYHDATEPHDRGAVLVAAVFDAFLRVYGRRSDDLKRLATGGTGVLPPGDIPDALVDALAVEAAKTASQWLNICVRALDYCPPIDLTFGEYLRALVTADSDIVPDDKRSYRVAFASAFRDRGIYAQQVRNVSVTSLRWEPPTVNLHSLSGILGAMSLDWNLHSNREQAYTRSRQNARAFHDWLVSSDVTDEEIDALGLVRIPVGSHKPLELAGVAGQLHAIEVHSVRPARWIGPDGQTRTNLVVEVTQSWYPDDVQQSAHRGGVTLIVDLETQRASYMIRKRVANEQSYQSQIDFEQAFADETLGGNYFQGQMTGEPFAMLHRMDPGQGESS